MAGIEIMESEMGKEDCGFSVRGGDADVLCLAMEHVDVFLLDERERYGTTSGSEKFDTSYLAFFLSLCVYGIYMRSLKCNALRNDGIGEQGPSHRAR
jgi:hypothetical protein